MRRFVGFGVIAAVSLVGACGKKPAPDVPAPPAPPVAAAPAPAPAPPPPPPAPAPAPAALTEEELFARMTIEELNQSRPLGDVFFALDSVELDGTATATLDRNATWLRRWTSTTIRVEGHADERGTAEYNLALSSRRATAVRNYLTSLGIPENRITVVGLGKEQPTCSASTESCWQQNRRGNPLIVTK